MSERTIITTIEVTKIYKNVSDDFEIDKTKYGKNMMKRLAKKMKKKVYADDVSLGNVQVFERAE